MTRHVPEAKAWAARKARTHGKCKTQAILAAKLGRAVYVMLRRGIQFNPEAFMQHGGHATGPGEPKRLTEAGTMGPSVNDVAIHPWAFARGARTERPLRRRPDLAAWMRRPARSRAREIRARCRSSRNHRPRRRAGA
jgi:hypothetical protein